MRRLVQLLFVLQSVLHVEVCQPNKCSTTSCYSLPPSPMMYPPPPTYSIAPMYPLAPSAAPSAPMAMPMPSRHAPMMIAAQTPIRASLNPSLASVSSSATAYEVGRWDRQEPEYKHVDEMEPIVAPDVVVADVVEEKSSNSEKVEMMHENERLTRMELMLEEPELIPFDNNTVTLHAWFLR